MKTFDTYIAESTDSVSIMRHFGGSPTMQAIGASRIKRDTDFSFELPSGYAKDNIRKVVISGNGGSYTMKFIAMRGSSEREVKVIKDVRGPSLRSKFEEITGVDTTV